jgi:hypothetical protein
LAPRCSERICCDIDAPPNSGTTLTPPPRAYLWIASATCIASSRVGTSTSPAVGWRPTAPASTMRCSIGNAKAAVFPVPVAACASRSRPSSTIGMVSRCTGVGSS